MTFALKHCILTLVYGPLLFIIKNCISDHSLFNLFDFTQLYFIMLFMGLIFSIPTYIIYTFVLSIIQTKIINVFYAKAILTLIIVIGIWTTLAIISGMIWLEIAISYSIAPVIMGLIFKLNFKDTTEI